MARSYPSGKSLNTCVNRHIGDAYKDVKEVADSLDDIREIGDNIEIIEDIGKSLDEIKKVADNLDGFATNERVALTNLQQVVDFVSLVPQASTLYVLGQSVDQGILQKDVDYLITGTLQVTLTRTYPAGTVIYGIQNIGSGESGTPPIITEPTDVFNRPVINLAIGGGR